MKPQPEPDGFHEGEWAVGEDGFFKPVQFELQHDNPIHAACIEVTRVLMCRIPAIVAVYLRGSALESRFSSRVRDVDLVVVLEDGPDAVAARSHVREWAKRLWHPGIPQLDIGCVTRSGVLRRQGGLAVLLALRSLRLGGESIWLQRPQIRPSVELAERLYAESFQDTERYVARLVQVEPPWSSPGVGWLQKRCLRLGAIESMARGGGYSRHPVTCARLVGETTPQLAEMANAVLRDYLATSTGDAAAWRRTHDFYRSLMRSSVLASAHPPP